MKNQTSTRRTDQDSGSVADTVPAPTNAPASAPRTRMERLVAKCWEEELKVTDISLEDDFFALGGDSHSAMQMIFHVQEQLPPLVPLGALFFQNPTLKGFAAQLSELFQIENEPDRTGHDA